MTKSLKIDFTGCAKSFTQFSYFNDEVIALLRSTPSPGNVLVIDRWFGTNGGTEAFLVRDHLNLTGGNPLAGPNHPCGERFTKVDDVYLTSLNPALRSIVAAGLKPNVVPSSKEVELLKTIGADCWCFNLVPTVLIAAHAGFNVAAVLLPHSAKDLEPTVEAMLTALDGN